MKLQFLLAGIVATGLFALAPDAVAHGGFGGGGGGFHGGGVFHGGGGFGGFHGGGRFAPFHGGRFGGFHGGRFGHFNGQRRFFVNDGVLFPGSVSLGSRGGGTGAGVIPIIGVIRITPTITLAITPTIEIPLTAS